MGQAPRGASFTRCVLVLLAATAGVAALATVLLPGILALAAAIRSGAVAGDPFDEVLVRVCETAVAGCAVWLWLATAVVAADAARGHRAPRRGIPAAVRTLVLAACGVALAGGLGAPAQAGDEATLDGLPLPDRATTTTHVSRVFARAARQERPPALSRLRPTVVVVEPGDTLWAIARAALPPHAGDGAVARRVREIHRVNRSVIGTDPDLIRPRQRLRVPRDATVREEHR